MASDRQQFSRASAQWEGLHEAGAYSASFEDGFTAVLVGAPLDEKTLVAEELYPEEILLIQLEQAEFSLEAAAIERRIHNDGRKAIVLESATNAMFSEVIRDPDISSIITIGHGDISGIGVSSDNGETIFYDWRSVLPNLAHLKQGYFVQRHCGRVNRNISVPLGLFCMADHRRVIAPVDEYFYPESIDDVEANRLLRSVSSVRQMSYDMVKNIEPDD